MAVAAAEQQTHPKFINHELGMQNDEATWLAEALYGSMRSEFDFTFDGNELIAEDGRALGPIFDGAVAEAAEMVKTQPNLLFELRRRVVEHQEYSEMLQMAQGQGPNTMVVVSDYPAELMDSDVDVGGYNATRKQAMVRVITRSSDGTVTIASQSLDGSDRTALEKIYTTFGITAEPGELLGQRITLDLPEQWQATLLTNIRETYDGVLTNQYGGKWFAGIAIGDSYRSTSTYDFVKQQHDILGWLTENIQQHPENAAQYRYNAAALLEQRYGAMNSAGQTMMRGDFVAVDITVLARLAGSEAERSGKTYSGCGMSLGSGAPAENQLEDSGYGNKSESEDSYSFNKVMHCVVCQSPPKKGEGKKSCGPCGICRTCDRKLGGKG